MRRRIKVVAVLAAAGVFVGTPGTGSAETVMHKDRRGDAAAKFDITGIAYANTASALAYHMTLRDITRKNGTVAFPKFLINGSWDRFFTVVSGARRDGTRFHRLEYSSTSEYRRVPCPGMTAAVNFRTNSVAARVPQTCLGEFAHQRYKTVGYAATPGMAEAGDTAAYRWVAYN
jgi:hypothetical protein